MIPQLKNIDVDLLRKIFDNNDGIDVPVDLFKTIMLMTDADVNQIVKQLGILYEYDNSLDIDGTEEELTQAICSAIERGIYYEPFVSATYFRLMFWEKAGVNAYYGGFVPPGFSGIFHKPNVCLCNRKSRQLAYLLRHDRDYIFDSNGWREVEDLIQNHGFTMPLLINIVATNDKQRFEFNVDRTMIRARQGHSVKVDVELKEATPSGVLYHGTTERVLPSILRDGLRPGARLHVHLSRDMETAIKVGQRHGDPVVLKIDVEAMNTDGVAFYLSKNGVWLTEFVASKYISLMDR